ncbi:hypothetical protein ABPG72_020481, partial [Tetrahymena utriculariae]
MASQSEQSGFIKKYKLHDSLIYLSRILLNTEAIDFRNSTCELSQNQIVEEIQIRQEAFIQNNKVNTIKKNVKAHIEKLKKQLSIKTEDCCVLNLHQKQFLLIIDKANCNQIQSDVKGSKQSSKCLLQRNQYESNKSVQINRKQEEFKILSSINQIQKSELNETQKGIKFCKAKDQEDQIQVENPLILIQSQDQSIYHADNMDSQIYQRNEQSISKEIQKSQNVQNSNQQLKIENQITKESIQEQQQECTLKIILDNSQNKKLRSQLISLKNQEGNQQKEYSQINSIENLYEFTLEDIGQNIIKSQFTGRNSSKNRGNFELELIYKTLNSSQVGKKPNEEQKELIISPNQSLKNDFNYGYERIQDYIEDKGDSIQDINDLQELKMQTIQSQNLQQQQTNQSINQDEMFLAIQEFNQCNKNSILNKKFSQNQDQIFRKLKQFQYQLCELRYSSDFEDTFYGYKKLDDNKKQSFIFKILYDISKSDQYDLQQDQTQSDQQSDIPLNQQDFICFQKKTNFVELQKLIQIIEDSENINLEKNNRMLSLSDSLHILIFLQENFVSLIK